MKKTAVVTGGAGFIGGALVRALVGSGDWTVANLDRLGYASSPAALAALEGAPGYSFHELDIRRRGAVLGLLRDLRPEVVLHLAAKCYADSWGGRTGGRPLATLEEFPRDAPAAGAGSCLIFSPVKYILLQFLLWNSRHSFSACGRGSCPRFAHQAFSSPTS